jgi:hypothetical protein
MARSIHARRRAHAITREIHVMTNDRILAAEDAALYANLSRQVLGELSRTRTSNECLLDQIEPLTVASELSALDRQGYARLARTLRRLVRLTRSAHRRFSTDSMERQCSALQPSLTDDMLPAIRKAIALLNHTEQRIRKALEQLTMRLVDPAKPSIEWADLGAEILVLILFEPSPERRFFDDLPDPNFFEVRPPFHWPLDGTGNDACLLGDGDNWNPFQDDHCHPLRDDFMGYLGHCLMEHEVLPWHFY